jgi:hypothetical protein
MADKDEYVSVIERGNMASPEYRAYLEKTQGLEGAHPEFEVAGLGLGSLLRRGLQQGGNFFKELLPFSKTALTREQKDNNLAGFLSGSKAPTLYHGTDRTFPSFDPKKLTRTTWGEGFHLAEDASLASQYAGRGQGANVIPLHAAIKNPLELKSIDEWFYKIPGATNEQKTNWVKSQGYDGIKYPHSKPTETSSGMAWVAFEPTQLKSTIGNRGTYSPNKKDFNKAEGGFIDKPVEGGHKII